MTEIRAGETQTTGVDILLACFEKMRPGEDVIPPSGFSERVVSRVKQLEQQSIWAPVIYSRVPVHITAMFLSLTLAIMGYVFWAEWKTNDPAFIVSSGSDIVVSSGNAQRQRDVALMQIVTYQKPN